MDLTTLFLCTHQVCKGDELLCISCVTWPQFAFVVIVQVADSASPFFLVSLLWFDSRKSCDVLRLLSVHLLKLTPEVPLAA